MLLDPHVRNGRNVEAAGCRFHLDCDPHVRLDAKRQDAASTFLVLIGFTPTTRFLRADLGCPSKVGVRFSSPKTHRTPPLPFLHGRTEPFLCAQWAYLPRCANGLFWPNPPTGEKQAHRRRTSPGASRPPPRRGTCSVTMRIWSPFEGGPRGMYTHETSFTWEHADLHARSRLCLWYSIGKG